MKEWEIKEANRYYWIVKGQLIPESWSETDVNAILNSYMKRIWGNHEAIVHEDGFERAWDERRKNSLQKTAVLGYN